MDIVLCENYLHKGKEVVEEHQIESNVEREDESSIREYAASLICEAEQRTNREFHHEARAFPSSAGASVLKMMHDGFHYQQLDCRADSFFPFLRPDQDLDDELSIATDEAYYFLDYRNRLIHLNHYTSTDEKEYAIKNRHFSPLN